MSDPAIVTGAAPLGAAPVTFPQSPVQMNLTVFQVLGRDGETYALLRKDSAEGTAYMFMDLFTARTIGKHLLGVAAAGRLTLPGGHVGGPT